MEFKDIKKMLETTNENINFQVLFTDSVYIPSKFQFELIKVDTNLGLYKVIAPITFNQYMKLKLKKNLVMFNKNKLYTQTFYKLIKE